MIYKIYACIVLIFSCGNINAQRGNIGVVNEVLKSSYFNDLKGYDLFKKNDQNERVFHHNIFFDELGNIIEDNNPKSPKKYKTTGYYDAILSYGSSNNLIYRELKICLSPYETLIYRDKVDQFPAKSEFFEIYRQIRTHYDSAVCEIGKEYFIEEFVYTRMSEKYKLYIAKAKFQFSDNVSQPEPDVSVFFISDGELIKYIKYNKLIIPIQEKIYVNNLISIENITIGNKINSKIEYYYNEEVLSEVIIKMNDEINNAIAFQYNETGRITGFVETNFLTGFQDSTFIQPIYR